MKKQINPTIKAHLIRGAFYLLLLVAVCAIPFALAQRNKLSSTRAHAIKAPPTKAQMPPRLGKVFSLARGAPWLVGGCQKARHRQNALPYDVRSAPNLPRISQVPQRTSGVRAAHVIPIPRAPKAPQVVLYDQYDNVSASPLCRRRSTTSPPSAPIWLTTLSCPEVRLGMCSRSTPMGCTSTALDLPSIGTSLFTSTTGAFPARKFTARSTSQSRRLAQHSR